VALFSANCAWVVEVGAYVWRAGFTVLLAASFFSGVEFTEVVALLVLELGDRARLADSTNQCLSAAS